MNEMEKIKLENEGLIAMLRTVNMAFIAIIRYISKNFRDQMSPEAEKKAKAGSLLGLIVAVFLLIYDIGKLIEVLQRRADEA